MVFFHKHFQHHFLQQDFCSKAWSSSMDSQFRLSEFRICRTRSKRTQMFFTKIPPNDGLEKSTPLLIDTIIGKKTKKVSHLSNFPLDWFFAAPHKKPPKKTVLSTFFFGALDLFFCNLDSPSFWDGPLLGGSSHDYLVVKMVVRNQLVSWVISIFRGLINELTVVDYSYNPTYN